MMLNQYQPLQTILFHHYSSSILTWPTGFPAAPLFLMVDCEPSCNGRPGWPRNGHHHHPIIPSSYYDHQSLLVDHWIRHTSGIIIVAKGDPLGNIASSYHIATLLLVIITCDEFRVINHWLAMNESSSSSASSLSSVSSSSSFSSNGTAVDC